MSLHGYFPHDVTGKASRLLQLNIKSPNNGVESKPLEDKYEYNRTNTNANIDNKYKDIIQIQ